MKKIKNLFLIVFVMFGLLLSISTFTVNACEDDTTSVPTIIVDDTLNINSPNDDNGEDASTNSIVVEDDNNPDGVFLLGDTPEDKQEQE